VHSHTQVVQKLIGKQLHGKQMYQRTWHRAPEDLNLCVSLKLGTRLCYPQIWIISNTQYKQQ